MSYANRILTLLKQPGRLIFSLGSRGFFRWLPDEQYLKLVYLGRMKKPLDLKNPQTFNEKLQWLKLYDRNPEYIHWVDKLAAKQKVAEIIGEKYVVPLIGAWEDPRDLDFNSLPNKFVLKCNHDQGSTIIVDKEKGADQQAIKRYFAGRLQKNPYWATREWPYKMIKPKIICEPFLQEGIIDYKLFCFNGEPRFINIGQKDPVTHETRVSFLSLSWELMPFQRTDFRRVKQLPDKPNALGEMLSIARHLSKGTRFVRIDIFMLMNNLFFSEFTLYPTSGFIMFDPPSYDDILGSWIDLKRFII